MLRFLIQILVIYAVYKLLRLIFAANKAQEHFTRQVNNMNESGARRKSEGTPKNGTEGDYVDYEEIK